MGSPFDPIKTQYVLGYSSFQTDTSFDSIAPTETAPTAGDSGIFVPGTHWTQLIFAGTDAANETYDVRIFGLNATENGLWVPTCENQFDVTLGAAVGVSGNADLTDSHFLADTITPSVSVIGSSSYEAVNIQNDLVASLLIDLRNYQYAQVIFDMTGAASGNFLWRPWMR